MRSDSGNQGTQSKRDNLCAYTHLYAPLTLFLRYHRIVYNAEAIEAEQYARTLPKDDAISGKDAAVYLHPLKFDAEVGQLFGYIDKSDDKQDLLQSIIKLVRHFGPLEKVSILTENHDLVKGRLELRGWGYFS